MDSREFLQTVQQEAANAGINPVLLLSGIEGLYTFRDVPAGQLNFQLLDGLILTIFALRTGDVFDEIAKENLTANDLETRVKAEWELAEMDAAAIAASGDAYLQSFAAMLGNGAPVRRYHRKALEVAAVEIKKAQLHFGNDSIGAIVLSLCTGKLKDNLHLAALFTR